LSIATVFPQIMHFFFGSLISRFFRKAPPNFSRAF
jgi:hypothetical protein